MTAAGRSVLAIDEAMRAVALVETPAEAREHENKAEAVAQYMRREGVGLEAQNKAAEYKLRAMRRGGQLLEDMGVKRGGGLKQRDVALVDLGIEKARSQRWYNITRIPDDCFDPLLKIVPEIFTSDFLAASKLASLEPEDRHACLRAIEDGRDEKQSGSFVRQHLARFARNAKHKAVRDAATAIQDSIDGPYPLIYADPPWTFDTFSWKGKEQSPEKHYPTMTDEEIMNFIVGGRRIIDLAHKDAALFMWCTSSNLVRALEIMKAWGFTYKTNAVWDKERTGTGYVFLNQHELILYGTRGSIPAPTNIRSSVFRFPRGRHSAKPPEVRAALENMYPHFDRDTRIELFARETVPGWTVDGYESS